MSDRILILGTYARESVKGNTRSITKRPCFGLTLGFAFLLCLQYLVVIRWKVDLIPNEYKHKIPFLSAESGLHLSASRRELPLSPVHRTQKNTVTIEKSKCQEHLAPHPVHVGGSGAAREYSKTFDFDAFPGSELRISKDIVYETAETMKEKATVTIITATNNPVYIDATAKSIFTQTYRLFNWIIVNDHSDEGTLINKYRHHVDSRVTVVDCAAAAQTACGPSKARNVALGLVETEYVVFLDDDDLLESTYLEKLVWFLESNGEFAYANSYSVDFGAKKILWDRTFYHSSLNENQQVITALIKTEALKTIADGKWPQVFEEDLTKGGSGGSEDWVMWLNLKSHGLHGATVPEYLFWYRIKENRRNWDFLESNQVKSSNLRRQLQKSTKAIASGFSPTIGKKMFPQLYIDGHTNPKLDACNSNDDHINCIKKISDPVPFKNIHDKNTKQNIGCNEKRRHIILVLPWMALGGSDMVNVKLVRLLSEQNWKITIVNTLSTSAKSSTSSSLEFFRPILQQYTEDIFTLPHFVRVKDYARFFTYLIESRNADVFLTSNSFAGYNLLPYLKTHSKNVVFADYVHMRQLDWKVGAYYENSEEIQGGGYPRLSGLFSDYLDLSLFVSDDERQWVSKNMNLESPKPNQQVVHYGIDTENFKVNPLVRQNMRKKFGINDDTMCVLFVGRLVDQKRPDVLVRVFHKLTQQLESHGKAKAHLLIAGDGALQGKVEKYIKDNNLDDKVEMLGRVNREDMSNVMSAGDVIFLPSKMEGLAVALIEAMGMGLVPVVTNVGGHREIVKEGSGCLLDRDDEDGMLECLTNLAVDSDARKHMSENAKDIVQKEFSFQTMKRNVHNRLVTAIEDLDHINYGKGAIKAQHELSTALRHIGSSDPSLSTLASALNAKNVPPRKTNFGKELAKLCGEDASFMSDWISMMETAYMCGAYPSAREMIGEHIKKQCGQWCVFDSKNPDKNGWIFNGKCFTEFTSEKHQCHEYTDLKSKLKKY